jgi:hypothetical protein
VALLGPGGCLPGLRQRLEHELRAVRQLAEMPRGLRPLLIEEPPADAAEQPAEPSSWPLSAAECAGWRGAAMACRPSDSHRRPNTSWIDADAFAREPLHAVKRALRAAGWPSAELVCEQGKADADRHGAMREAVRCCSLGWRTSPADRPS